jgi:hypothetical protein
MKRSLQQEQQFMLNLLKKGITHDEVDPLMLSKLSLQRKIIVWWRCFQFEHWLILTSKILKDRQLFEPLVSSLYQQTNISSYPAEAGEQFVQHISVQSIPEPIKSVASMELALIKLKEKDNKNEYRIYWNQSPMQLLDALINGQPYTLMDTAHTTHEMVLSNSLSGKMMVYELN